TAQRDFDRLLGAWLVEEAPDRAPIGLAEATIARVGTTARRPGWQIIETWLSPDVLRWFAPAPRVALLVAVAALTIVGVGLLLLVGAPRPTYLPGARPGAIDYLGDDRPLYGAAIGGPRKRALTTPDTVAMINGAFSPDGRSIAYVTSDRATGKGVRRLEIADADGSHPRAVKTGLAWSSVLEPLRWSPDASAIAFMSNDD